MYEPTFALVNCTGLAGLVQGGSHLSCIDQECCSSICVDRLPAKEQNLGKIGLGREGQQPLITVVISFSHTFQFQLCYIHAVHPCSEILTDAALF